MRKLCIASALAIVLCLITSFVTNATEVKNMTDKVIRLHVIANSDSEYDQAMKLIVRDAVLDEVNNLISECNDKSDAIELIYNNLDRLKEAADSSLDKETIISCTLEKSVFDKRVYDSFSLPAGEYDSLCIRIGEANGKNWWCVCYPSLCLFSAVDLEACDTFTEDEIVILKTPEKVKYKLLCFELFGRLKGLFKS